MNEDLGELVAKLSPEGQRCFGNKPPTNTYPLKENVNSTVYIYPDSPGVASERHTNVTQNVTNRPSPTENVTESLRKRIEDYGLEVVGRWLSYEDLDKELNLKSQDEKHNRRMAMLRLREDGLVELHPTIAKQFRFIDKAVRLIDFKQFTQRTPLDIKWPFGLEKLVKIYKKNIIVIAGAPDAGKTAAAFNVVRKNQDKYPINYMTSEMGGEEMAERLSMFEDIELDEWTFTVEERTHNFHDGIRPDDINIIDYLELTKDAWEVAEYLRQIHDKLRGGIAIVLLQMKHNAKMGRGAEYSLEKPRLYIALDNGEGEIIKAKNWVDKNNNPNGMVIKYKIVGGYKFVITEDWHKS